MKTVDLSKTKIEIIGSGDFTVWGGWHGDQGEAIELIRAIPDFAENVNLWDVDGRHAGDNTFEGAFVADLSCEK